MAAKDSFDAFLSILRDKIDALSEDANKPNIKIIQNELKEKIFHQEAWCGDGGDID